MGGGGGGGTGSYACGGGGGYTSTTRGYTLPENRNLICTVGAGGEAGADGGTTKIATT